MDILPKNILKKLIEMEISNTQPIPNEPVLFIKKKKILVFADLHIGIEGQLREQGVLTKSLASQMINKIFSICEKYKPNDIILLGDIKHNIPMATIQERKDVRNFLRLIEEYGKIHIIPGNHDGNISRLSSEKILIHSSTGLVLDNIGFVHGHCWPKQDVLQCKLLIMAHTHPTVMFLDRMDFRTFEPCWIKGQFISEKIKERYPDSKNESLLIMPAFNPLCGGSAVNHDGIVGPLGRIIDIDNSQLYLIDGSSLGKVKDIK